MCMRLFNHRFACDPVKGDGSVGYEEAITNEEASACPARVMVPFSRCKRQLCVRVPNRTSKGKSKKKKKRELKN